MAIIICEPKVRIEIKWINNGHRIKQKIQTIKQSYLTPVVVASAVVWYFCYLGR